MNSEEPPKEQPTISYHGIDQITQVTSDAWEEFFRICREYAAIARQRRDARNGHAVASQYQAVDQ